MDTKKSKKLTGDVVTKKRREFLKKAGTFGMTAPMAALLLSVGSKSSRANMTYGYNDKAS